MVNPLAVSRSVTPRSTIRAIPKSAINGRPSRSRMFDGLMSR